MSKLYNLFLESKLYTVKWTNYFKIYETLFSEFIGKPVTFVEIGVLDGGSLLMWREYFGPAARIIGIDNNPKCKDLEKLGGFEILIGDQSDPEFWMKLKNNISIDILLDDGGHTNKQQIISTIYSIDLINEGGMIVIEDTHSSYMKEYGNPSKYSFIEYCKNMVDDINSRFAKSPKSIIQSSVHSIQFFESIVCFRISCKDSIQNKKVANKQKNDMVDYRYNKNKAVKILTTLREISFPLIGKIKIFNKVMPNPHYFVMKFQNKRLARYFKN
jgi:hypothetical protein